MRDKHKREIQSIVKKQDFEESGLLRKIRDMLDELISLKELPPAQKPKHRRDPRQKCDGASSCFVSLNQFAVCYSCSEVLHVGQWFASCRSRPFPNWPVNNSVTHNNEILKHINNVIRP